MIQQSKEWFDAKRGITSASHISDIMAKGRGGKPSTTRRNYMTKLLIERLTGETEESYTNAAMANGTDQEPYARAAYEAEYGVDVEQVGFILHPTIEKFGASPDGHVSADGSLEIKCPSNGVHLDYYRARIVPRDYILQMHGQMMCTERTWCDWVSYAKAFPVHMRLIVIRVERDEALCVEITREVKIFNIELDLLEKEMRG